MVGYAFLERMRAGHFHLQTDEIRVRQGHVYVPPAKYAGCREILVSLS